MITSSYSLDELLPLIWNKIEKAVQSRHEPWHLVTVGTARKNEPEMRTLVLRGCDPKEQIIWMHTDLRSEKCRDIEKSPHGSLLFYDPIARWQLRLKGVFLLDPDSSVTESAWKKTTASARRCYQGPFTPGTPSEFPSTNLPPTDVGPNIGRENFTRLIFKISKMDWLFLKSDGHQRAQWKILEEDVRGSWVAP